MKTDLRRLKAESSGLGVGLLSVLQDQAAVVGQRQITTSGEVAQTEGLTPSNVASTPAKHRQLTSKTWSVLLISAFIYCNILLFSGFIYFTWGSWCLTQRPLCERRGHRGQVRSVTGTQRQTQPLTLELYDIPFEHHHVHVSNSQQI